jgi:hypothetical protein
MSLKSHDPSFRAAETPFPILAIKINRSLVSFIMA